MNPIKEQIRSVMKEHGYRCKRTSWYRQVNDVVQIFNIQKSVWGDQYYINLGINPFNKDIVFPKEYNFPPEYKFSVRFRVDDIIKDKILLNSLNFENDNQNRMQFILDLTELCLSFLDRLSTRQAVIDYCRTYHPYLTVEFASSDT